jgi:hypothetical protein
VRENLGVGAVGGARTAVSSVLSQTGSKRPFDAGALSRGVSY